MQRAAFRAALAEALKGRILAADGVEPQLHMVYLANDSLFNRPTAEAPQGPGSGGSCLQQPVLGSMLAAICDNPQNAEVNWDQLQKTLQFWGAKEVFEQWHASICWKVRWWQGHHPQSIHLLSRDMQEAMLLQL
ncbi:unnamed protein product [Sphagnum balticum]